MKTSKLLNKFYYNKKNWIDGTSYFISLIKRYCRDNFIVLDLGCGSGAGKDEAYSINKCVKMLVGVDISISIVENNIVSYKVIGDAFHLPFAKSSFDLIYSDYVLEHIDDPDIFLTEVHRILKNSGYFIFRTPNKYHYVPLIGRLIPSKIKTFAANFTRGLNLRAETFKTYYRMNSANKLKKIFIRKGFRTVHLELIEKEPSYMMFNELAFFVGLIFERMVNSSTYLSFFRSNIIAVFQKCT